MSGVSEKRRDTRGPLLFVNERLGRLITRRAELVECSLRTDASVRVDAAVQELAEPRQVAVFYCHGQW